MSDANAAKKHEAPAIANPHNPDFITKKPWYLGNDEEDPVAAADAAAVTLEHQNAQKLDYREELTLTAAERVLEDKRSREKLLLASSTTQFHQGQWVEGLKKNKPPYRICQITKVHGGNGGNGGCYDLQFEDGFVERKVKLKASGGNNNSKPQIRCTRTGNRSLQPDEANNLKETYDSKRDSYHGYDRETHNRKLTAKFEEREQIRREFRETEKLRKKAEKAERKINKAAAGGDGKEGDGDGDGKGDGGGIGGGDGGGGDDAASSSSGSDSEGRGGDGEGGDSGRRRGGGGGGSDDDDSDEEFVQRDEDARVMATRLARQGGVGGAQMKVTARNLRIREDTAKYLRNLDPNSAYYDPKSRSMRDNPHPEAPPDDTDFAGDNFARVSGDAVGLADTQLFAWDASDKGVNEIHPQANPSQAELLKKEFRSQESELKLQRKKAVLDKYGGGEYLDGTGGLASAKDAGTNNNGGQQQQRGGDGERKQPAVLDRKLRFGVSTTVEEYSRDGRLLKSGGRDVKYKALESRYEEDVYLNGHTTTWGSFFHRGAFQWGYADDHSLMKNSYCTGANGRMANDEANEMRYGTGQAGSAELATVRGLLKAIPSQNKDGGAGGGGGSAAAAQASVPAHISRSKLYGEADLAAEVDQDKVKDALKRAAATQDEEDDRKKRKYNSLNTNEEDIKEEDMEAYRLLKGRKSDPMANIGSDKLLDYKK